MTINIINLQEIDQLISQKKNCSLLIVTKNQSEADIVRLINLGFHNFGENKVQEAKTKFNSLNTKYKLNLHFIGPLQTNKVKAALKLFDTIQSIDRKNLINEIAKLLKNKNYKFKTKNFYLQINIGNESQKSGVNLEDAKEIYNYCLDKGLKIHGLMCIPPVNLDPSKYFLKMNQLRDSLNKSLILSMGMSNDYATALNYNSNMIRVGSAIFKK